MKNKKTKILIGVIAFLVVALGVVSIYFIAGNKKKNNTKNQGTTQVTTENEKQEETTEKAEADQLVYLYKADIKDSATWESGSDKCATKEVIIYNDSDKAVSSWKIDISLASAPKIDSIWNGKQTIKDNVITVTPEDYNSEIAAHGNISFGFNVSGTDISLADYVLYIDGKEYKGSELSKEEAATTEEATEEKVVETEEVDTPSGTPVDNHGALSVSGTQIVDKNGKAYQLKGVSSHGITWFPDYVNEDGFKSLRDDWGANLVRLAMYTDTGDSYGYASGGDKDDIENLLDTGVKAATELGMYVIIDWHILKDTNPNTYIDDAKTFFKTVSKKYAKNENVIYEICNEPNGGTSWGEIKSYAETIIPIIRKNDKDAIIIVGTPNWSQDVDVAAEDPIKDYDNIVYAVHFYAATHKDDMRKKVQTALDKKLPVFVSEFSICDASGNGGIDYDSADEWFKLINDNKISFSSWSLCNKDETASLIKSSCSKTSGWSEDDLSETGKWIKSKIKGN